MGNLQGSKNTPKLADKEEGFSKSEEILQKKYFKITGYQNLKMQPKKMDQMNESNAIT